MYTVDAKTGLRYFTECEVYIVAETQLNNSAIQGYSNDYNLGIGELEEKDQEYLVEFAGKHCYMSFNNGRPTDSYIANIIEHKHFSVLEHVVISVLFRGVSRGFTHEIVRHRHLSPSQFSTRYCYPKDFAFVVPTYLSEDKDIFLAHCLEALNKYKDVYKKTLALLKTSNYDLLHRKKAARGTARAFLPIGMEAPIILTGNLRSWKEIFEKRISENADIEIRTVMRNLLDQLRLKFKRVFNEKD